MCNSCDSRMRWVTDNYQVKGSGMDWCCEIIGGLVHQGTSRCEAHSNLTPACSLWWPEVSKVSFTEDHMSSRQKGSSLGPSQAWPTGTAVDLTGHKDAVKTFGNGIIHKFTSGLKSLPSFFHLCLFQWELMFSFMKEAVCFHSFILNCSCKLIA